MAEENSGIILIVDDETDLCWALDRILKQVGFQTVSAGSAQEALSLMGRGPFRLAFIDAMLPDMAGYDLALRLRQLQPGLPVILISGYYYSGDGLLQQWLASNAICGFIGKPFLLEEVRETTLHLA